MVFGADAAFGAFAAPAAFGVFGAAVAFGAFAASPAFGFDVRFAVEGGVGGDSSVFLARVLRGRGWASSP